MTQRSLAAWHSNSFFPHKANSWKGWLPTYFCMKFWYEPGSPRQQKTLNIMKKCFLHFLLPFLYCSEKYILSINKPINFHSDNTATAVKQIYQCHAFSRSILRTTRKNWFLSSAVWFCSIKIWNIQSQNCLSFFYWVFILQTFLCQCWKTF